MDKKQKKMLVSIMIILLLIIILTGYTFAKCYSSYNSISDTKISKWSFYVNGCSNFETQSILLTDTVNNVNLEDGKIVPGASGKFNLELDASNLDVDVKYSIDAIETGNKPSNLVFSVEKDGERSNKQYSSIKELTESELNGVISKDDNKIKTFKIVWNWPYETGSTEDEIKQFDKNDNSYGNGTVKNHENEFNYSFSLKIIGTQTKI